MHDPIEAKFQKLETELYLSIGEMVKIWAELESWIAHCFQLLLFKNGTSRQGETIYYALQSINNGLSIVDAALFNRDDLKKEVKDGFAKILVAVKQEAQERNRIIHGNFERGAISQNYLDIAYVIVPKAFSDKQRPKPPGEGVSKWGYDVNDVRRHIERIQNLHDAVWASYRDLGGNDSFPPKSSSEYYEIWRENCNKCVWPSVITKKSTISKTMAN